MSSRAGHDADAWRRRAGCIYSGPKQASRQHRESNALGFLRDERGAEFVEWVVVTLIMIVATFAILQAVGGEISAFVEAAITWVRNLLGL